MNPHPAFIFATVSIGTLSGLIGMLLPLELWGLAALIAGLLP